MTSSDTAANTEAMINESLVQITSDTHAYVEVTVQLATGESTTFRREYVGGMDTSPLEILDQLADAVKSYLETF